MNKHKFYFVNHSGQSKFCYAYQNLSFAGYDNKICHECGRKKSSILYSCDKHQLVIEGGKSYPDFLQFCGAGDKFILLSYRAIEAFKESKISGFIADCKPKLFKSVNDNIFVADDAPDYYIVRITGKVDYDFQAMFLKKKKQCNTCGQYDLNRKRLFPAFIDIKTWDGSDFCSLITFANRIICSEQVVEVVKNFNLTGFDFEIIKTKEDNSACVNQK